jgi:hypothetical protein
LLIPALAGGLVVVLAAVWVTSALVLGVGRFWAGRTPAGELLGRIALVAANSDDLPPVGQVRDDQFIYIETYGGFGQPPTQRQIWLSVDGSRPGLLHDPRVTGGGPDERLDPPAQPDLNAPTFRYLTTLPTDPDLLLLKIYQQTWGHGTNPQQEAFATIGDLIRESVVPPDLAVALYHAAARIPGVTVVDDSVDALGRHGIAVARTDGGDREEWIFDRNTLQFRGERDVTADGSVGGSTAVVSRAVVDHAGDLPA